MSQKPNVLIVGCIDRRLRRWLYQYTENLVSMGYDPDSIYQELAPGAIPRLAGAITETSSRSGLIKDISFCVKHGVREIHLVTHEDCAAIGGSKAYVGDPAMEEKNHLHFLKLAKKKILEMIPGLNLEIKLVYVPKSEFAPLNK